MKKNHTEKIKALLYKALKTDNTEVLFYHILCKLLIHDNSFADALAIIQKVGEHNQSLNERTHSLLLLGICNDLLGERKQALDYYNTILSTADKNSTESFPVNKLVVAFAAKYIKSAFKKKNKADRSVEVSFSQSSGLE